MALPEKLPINNEDRIPEGDFVPRLIYGKPPVAEPIPKIPDWAFKAIIILMLAAVAYFTFAGRLFQPLFQAAKAAHWSKIIVRPSLLWGMMGMVLLTFRTIAWFRYRPFPSAGMADSPSLTVIIPAYNEGPMVRQSIDSVAAALYPHDRLEIFVVDDGSKDDTWLHIQAAARNYPGLVTPLRFPKNRGKRAALEAGFRRARGEIVVTID